MGGGSWTTASYCNYASTRGFDSVINSKGNVELKSSYRVQDLYKQSRLHESVNPAGVIRECCDSAEHPNTVPVILGLDVTGSMGGATAECAKKINDVMTDLYKDVKDVEFCCMGIGDFYCDRAPLQVTQFESDIRVAEQLEKIWFEAGGGGNSYESYTAAWWFGVNKCKLDCWKRGKKGLIITMGDEPLNPYLAASDVSHFMNEKIQGDIETEELWKAVKEKYEVYHLIVMDHQTCASSYGDQLDNTWGKYLDEDHLKRVSLQNIGDTIINIVKEHAAANGEAPAGTTMSLNENGEVIWA